MNFIWSIVKLFYSGVALVVLVLLVIAFLLWRKGEKVGKGAIKGFDLDNQESFEVVNKTSYNKVRYAHETGPTEVIYNIVVTIPGGTANVKVSKGVYDSTKIGQSVQCITDYRNSNLVGVRHSSYKY